MRNWARIRAVFAETFGSGSFGSGLDEFGEFEPTARRETFAFFEATTLDDESTTARFEALEDTLPLLVGSDETTERPEDLLDAVLARALLVLALFVSGTFLVATRLADPWDLAPRLNAVAEALVTELFFGT